ncbi:MAG: HDIG domain-containing protein [Syntrophobacterales bacterium]|jgi:putative nucleotidyltransferase with HDIG domain|nr:HDIG domain-containing protein [Syntrophobacterales bacterium]
MQILKDKKDKPTSHPDWKKISVLFFFALALTLIIHIRYPFQIARYNLGDISRENIKSPSELRIPGTGITVKKGEIIVREGERVNDLHLSILSRLNELEKKEVVIGKFLSIFALLFLSIAVIYEYARTNIKKFALSQKDLIFGSLLTVFTISFVKALVLIFGYFVQDNATYIFYIVPIFLFGIIMRIVLFSEATIIFSLILSIAMGFAFQESFAVFLYTLLANILASHFSGRCENRNTILKAGIYTAFIMSFAMILFHVFFGESLSDIPIKIVFILLSGIGSSFIALGLLPIIEHLFAYTTDIKLLELANLEHPLLEAMMVEAPGTYHHSILVGNLAKAAAESIGAHPLLTRVSAYYHDIGKLKLPHYFIENRISFDDAHKGLSPNMSALIILSHVKEGVDLADKYKLGRKITEMIRQHHGTSVVSYFFSRAKELEDPKFHLVNENDFRYLGPKPQTRDAGILMLADAVEASSRTLEEPTPKRIETHIQNIIENIFLDGQLDECELTLKDLYAIQKSFITILIGIFHHRIQYPERTTNDGADKRFPKIVQNGQKAHTKDNGKPTQVFKATG